MAEEVKDVKKDDNITMKRPEFNVVVFILLLLLGIIPGLIYYYVTKMM